MSQHKKDMGKMGEALVIQQLLEHSCSAFVEFGDNSKIDIICQDESNRLHTIQVKTIGRSKKEPDVTKLLLYKSGPNYQFKYSSADINWFAIVDAETKQIAWIKSTICDEYSRGIHLRHSVPKQKNQHGYKMFADYTSFPFL